MGPMTKKRGEGGWGGGGVGVGVGVGRAVFKVGCFFEFSHIYKEKCGAVAIYD